MIIIVWCSTVINADTFSNQVVLLTRTPKISEIGFGLIVTFCCTFAVFFLSLWLYPKTDLGSVPLNCSVIPVFSKTCNICIWIVCLSILAYTENLFRFFSRIQIANLSFWRSDRFFLREQVVLNQSNYLTTNSLFFTVPRYFVFVLFLFFYFFCHFSIEAAKHETVSSLLPN